MRLCFLSRGPISLCRREIRAKPIFPMRKARSISVIDTASRRVIASIPVGPIPGESQVTPDGRKFFFLHQVGSHGSCPVDVIDTATDSVITTVDIPGHWAKDILITPDSRFVIYRQLLGGRSGVVSFDSWQAQEDTKRDVWKWRGGT